MRLLLVEDDELLGDALKIGLTQFGYSVEWLKDGDLAKSAFLIETFDLVILDLGLPKVSGLQLLQYMRQQDNPTPVLILTARDAIEDRIRGLDMGADDYMVKPFDLNELSARVRALVRRSHGRANTVIQHGNIVLDPSAYTVKVDGEEINLPRREFTLLQKLLEHVGQALTRDQLLQTLYGWDDDVDSNVLEVHIHNLRKKLNTHLIRTIWGVGYMISKSV